MSEISLTPAAARDRFAGSSGRASYAREHAHGTDEVLGSNPSVGSKAHLEAENCRIEPATDGTDLQVLRQHPGLDSVSGANMEEIRGDSAATAGVVACNGLVALIALTAS